MRINNADKSLIKREIRGVVVRDPRINISGLASEYRVSRVTMKRWVEEIRNDQVRALDKETLDYELWRLAELGNNYIRHLVKVHEDMQSRGRVNHFVELGLLKTAWDIDKEIFRLRMDIFSRGLTANQVNIFSNKGGVAVSLNSFNQGGK